MRCRHALPLGLSLALGIQAPASAEGWFQRAMTWLETEINNVVPAGHQGGPRPAYPGADCGCAPRPVMQAPPEPGAGGFAAQPVTGRDGFAARPATQPLASPPQIRQAATPGAAAPGPFATWRDPVEGAFTLDVPRDWQIQGGLVRHADDDLRPVVEATSPDGAVYVFAGDPNLPAFLEPDPMLATIGLTEGQRYAPLGGPGIAVRRYLPAGAFLEAYVGMRFGQSLAGMRPIAARPRHDLSQEYGAILQQVSNATIQHRLDSAELEFAAHHRGRPLHGYVLTMTLRTTAHMPGVGSAGQWRAGVIYGFVAPPGRAAEARAVLARMAETSRLDPAWAQQQNQRMLAAAQAQQQTSAALSRAISANGDAIMQRWQTIQETSDIVASGGATADIGGFSDYIRGQETLVDPGWNEEHRVWRDTTSNHHWVDDSGTIIGTQHHANPDPSRFREMQPR